MAVVIHTADIQDRDGAKLGLAKLIGRFPRLELIWADAGLMGAIEGSWWIGLGLSEAGFYRS